MAVLDQEEYFTDTQVAAMLGKHPVTIRKWRAKNNLAKCIRFGPPYEYHGPNVVYPATAFRKWCSKVEIINGVPHMNLAVTPGVELPQTPPLAVEVVDGT